MKPTTSKKEELVAIEVWDWQTRVLHWLNAILIISLVIIILGAEAVEELGFGEATEDWLKSTHAQVGRIFAITLTLRILWGFVGNRYARWSDMLPFTQEKRRAIVENIRWYLSGFRGKAPVHIGHNPLASLFYIALFIVLVVQALTGLLLAGIEFNMFPASLLTAGLDEHSLEELEEAIEEIHEFGLWFVIFFFIAHMTGLIAHHLFDRGGLLGSMIQGKKYFKKDELEL